ncbi:MAG: LPS-assembly protein LptD [Pseudomonadales bacterium]|nr:LPS-assembly protein LptD [Pseudomonadales bacterium]
MIPRYHHANPDPSPSRPSVLSRKLTAIIRHTLSRNVIGALLVGTLPVFNAHAQQQAADVDWVPLDQLTPEQRAQVPDACCGRYIEPKRAQGNGDDLSLSADALNTEDESTILLEGNIQILEQDKLIQSEHGNYDRNSEILELSGDIRVRQPGVLITGASASVDRLGKSAQVSAASYVLHDDAIRGQAEIIVYRDEAGIITIDNGVYTRCEPGNNSWLVKADEITLNQKSGRGAARNVTLRVKDVPVFYTPYISFPINDERSSGFLFPTMGVTRNGGIDFAAPYYFNLAPNYDATFTPRLQADRGVMGSLEARYRGRNSTHVLNTSYLPSDDLFDPDTVHTPGSDSPSSKDRWLLSYDHSGRLGTNWSTYVDYSEISDDQYFQDFGGNGLILTSQSLLTQAAQINYVSDNWRFSTSTLGFQVIDPTVAELDKPYDRLPRVALDAHFVEDFNLEYGVASEYIYFDRNINRQALTQAQIDDGALVTGHRFSVEPSISLPWSGLAGFIKPTAKYKFAQYELDDQALGSDKNPSRGVFVGSIDSGLFFERDFDLNGSGFTQTLEPRLFYLYSEFEDQSDIPVFDSSAMTFSFNQLFREDRFSGKDRIGDSNQLTVALSSRLLNARGREQARFSLGQIFFFEDRRVTLDGQGRQFNTQSNTQSSSALVNEMSWQLSERWRANSYLEWNTSSDRLDVGTFQFRYQSDDKHILNLGYRYREIPDRFTPSGLDRRISQTDISAIWPLKANWNLIGRWNFDHSNDRSLETIAGLQYSSCCWSMAVIARQWIDNNALFLGDRIKNNGVFLQFELKGFGSVLGGSVTSILNNGISGYRE